MIEMCERIVNSGELDVRINTTAAIAYWKVCENSTSYKGINLNDICRNHEKMQE